MLKDKIFRLGFDILPVVVTDTPPLLFGDESNEPTFCPIQMDGSFQTLELYRVPWLCAIHAYASLEEANVECREGGRGGMSGFWRERKASEMMKIIRSRMLTIGYIKL